MPSSPGFRHESDRLLADGVSVAEIAFRYETPLYIYSAARIRARLDELRTAFGSGLHQIHYAVKACSNLSILRLLVEEGVGFDVVSGGELERCLKAGAPPESVVFAGAGKTDKELTRAIGAGVGCVHVESLGELRRLAELAALQDARVRVALRVNPEVDADTHEYVTTGREDNKFGIEWEAVAEAMALVQESRTLYCDGLHVHIGSQITRVEPFREVARLMAERIRELRVAGFPIDGLDLGGGFPVPYEGPTLSVADIAAAVGPELEGLGVKLLLEPGRFLVADAGILVTRVIDVKQRPSRTFVVVDAGMNDLLRPTLYRSYHEIGLVDRSVGDRPMTRVDVVGPICETGDYLARGRDLPLPMEGDLLAVFCAGAYGSTMASNYNTRPRPAEVLVEAGDVRLIRRRETLDDLLGPEQGLAG